MDKKFWFFGSKLNTALLLILIILMVIAIRIMLRNEKEYFGALGIKVNTEQTPNKINDDWKKYPLDNTPGYPCGIQGDECLTELQLQKILGNKNDLLASSIVPGAKVHGILSYRGVIQGGYFFEGNILINILNSNKKVLKKSNAVAKGDWTTSGPVSFEGNIDFTGLPTGPAYFEIHNDNASGIPANDKSILIPIMIE